MKKIPFHRSNGTVYADLGFTSPEVTELTAKSARIDAIEDTITIRKLTQMEAARLCGADQSTLSKVLRGRMESMTIDRLAAWLMALGPTIEIWVRTYHPRARPGGLVAGP